MTKTVNSNNRLLDDFTKGKSVHTLALFHHFIAEFYRIGKIEVRPAKTMIGIATSRKRIAYVTHVGKNFVHVVFPFDKAYPDNLCFQKIAMVPMKPGNTSETNQFNHHFRMLSKEDLNEEVRGYMRLAYKSGT